mmetsp:Transcript_33156/g.40764  ORF Transcript_33156/g.40764 Transcript_33156/m.40764 type:complete len:111 (-) Transcript_33156:169-501(-)
MVQFARLGAAAGVHDIFWGNLVLTAGCPKLSSPEACYSGRQECMDPEAAIASGLSQVCAVAQCTTMPLGMARKSGPCCSPWNARPLRRSDVCDLRAGRCTLRGSLLCKVQ